MQAGTQVRLGIDAPKEVTILREELRKSGREVKKLIRVDISTV